MKLRVLMFVCAAGFIAAPGAKAAPTPSDSKNSAGPAIAVQTKSIDEILDLVKSTAKAFLPQEMYREFEKGALQKLDTSALKGIDLKKPFGVYATLDASLKDGDFSKSSLVFLIPISDEKEFLGLLEKAGIKPEKKGDVYSIPVPNVPVDASLRFMKGYAYFGFAGDKLDVKMLLDPAEVIAPKEMSPIALRIRLDRIPAELKDAGIAMLEQLAGLANAAPIPPEAKGMVDDLVKMAMRCTKLAFNDGKEIVCRLDLDPKTGSVVSEYTVDAKRGSALAKSIADIKPTKNDFTGIVGSDSVAHLLFQTPLFIDEVQSILLKALELGEKKAGAHLQNGAPKEFVDLADEAFKTLKRTLKSGDLDMAASLRGPDKNDLYTVVGAVSLKDTAALEKSIKSAVKIVPNEVGSKINLDSFKVEGVNVHELTTSDAVPPDAQKVFGKSNVYIALAADALFVTFGPQAKEMIKEALSAKQTPKPAPLVEAEISGKKLLALLKNTGAPKDGPDGELLARLGKFDRLTLFSGKLEGGDKLVVRKEFGLMPILLFGARSERGVMVAPMAPKPPVKQ